MMFDSAFILTLCMCLDIRKACQTHLHQWSAYMAFTTAVHYPDSKVHGANMGPIWGRQDPGGPHIGPINFAIWVTNSAVLKLPFASPLFPVILMASYRIYELTHWGRDEAGAISQTSFSNAFSYMLRREYRVVRYRYSRLLFTSEDCLCANLRVQEQSTIMTSQCQCPTFAWHHRSTVVTSQY